MASRDSLAAYQHEIGRHRLLTPAEDVKSRSEELSIMELRPLLKPGIALGALALGAVQSGQAFAMAVGENPVWIPMPDPAEGGVVNPPFSMNLDDEERALLQVMDDMDFDVFPQRDWERLAESHAENVRAHWPDGHYTDGIEKHIEDMKALVAFAPDTRIEVHPLRVAKDNLTAVTGVMKGTFTQPMPDGKGGTIAPTGKAFAINMATVAIWNRQRKMDEEFLFWDTLTFNQQIGLA